MSGSEKKGGQSGVSTGVLKQSLCTGCAACVNICPYMVSHKDTLVVLHECDRDEGRCYDYCPRTPTDLGALVSAMFAPEDMTPELGAFKGLYMTRAADEEIRAKAQHGGTVSALMALAIAEGIIDAAILSDQNNQWLPEGTMVVDPVDVASRAKSKFVVSPTLAVFNRVSSSATEKFGIVATPCQALAVAKMKQNAPESDRQRVQKIRLVIGLFCGWALDWKKLTRLLAEKIGRTAISGIDIPPSKHACMEVYTDSGTIEIPIEEVNPCVRENCRYCFDMTCEFSDISVGSARSPEGWKVDRHWNQVIVRSTLGEELLKLARERGVLEFKPVPSGNIEKLKRASVGKKRTCLKNLAKKSGSDENLIYLDPADPELRAILSR